MNIVSALLFAAGALLVALTLYDAFCTALTVGGGGPLTNHLAHGLWQGALRWHRRRERRGAPAEGGSHKLLTQVGPAILIGIILLWVALLWTGFLLVYSAKAHSVAATSTDVPAAFWERVYFTGFTISTLGLGDFVPKGTGARLLTAFASLSGLFVMTLSITYLVGVISAVVAKRRLATSIAGLGQTPQEILRAGWDGESLASLEQPLVSLASDIDMHAQRHLAYPILHFFHTGEERSATGPRIAALSEALRLMGHLPGEMQPPPAATHMARNAIDGFLGTLRAAFVRRSDEEPERCVEEMLREAGLPARREEGVRPRPNQVTDRSTRRRRLLRALVEDDGWHWKDVTEAEAKETREAS